jgi:phage shock protein PspC (stress-responsive transcriptional regulator)
MDVIPPPLAPPDPSDTDRHGDAAEQRIVGGVCALLADRLDVDALWVRLAFVLLALTGGIGVVLYVGMWLALVVGEGGRSWARVAGGVLVVAGIPLVLSAGSFDLMTGPLAVVALLVGLALALWRPSGSPRRNPVAATPPVAAAAVVVAEPSVPREPRRRRVRVHRQRSPLGRATLGVAIAVAAGGALIDLANGGRLHPEQWLGAAAAVCGLGLLVGTFRGRGRWLVVPAVLFAGAGYAGGTVTRLGIELGDGIGDEWVNIGQSWPGTQLSRSIVAGTLRVSIEDEPTSQVRVDARVGFGSIEISAPDDVTVLVRTRIDQGTVRVNGVQSSPSAVRVGPDGEPDVVIDARVGFGSVNVWTYSTVPGEVVPAPVPPGVSDPGALTPVSEGVAMSARGWFLLSGSEAIIDDRNAVIVGDTYPGDTGAIGGEQVTVVQTSIGEFRLLPQGVLLTPYGQLLDLEAVRTELGATTPSATTPPASVTTGAP